MLFEMLHPLLYPVQSLPPYAVIIRVCWERGETQRAALTDLRRRGLWLTEEQKRHAGWPDPDDLSTREDG
jgi:hypothetical protein